MTDTPPPAGPAPERVWDPTTPKTGGPWMKRIPSPTWIVADSPTAAWWDRWWTWLTTTYDGLCSRRWDGTVPSEGGH